MPQYGGQNDADNGDGDGIDGGDAKSVQERIGGFVRDEVDPDGSLIGPGEEAEPVGDVPFLYGVGDVGEEPDDQPHRHKGGDNLSRPLDDPAVSPHRDTVVRQSSR